MNVARATASSARGRRAAVRDGWAGGAWTVTVPAPLRCTCTSYKYVVEATPYDVQLSTVAPPKTATRPSLTREGVADRALALADAEGLEAVTIRRLATELGVTPMALYWHFRTKEDLLAGLADRVLDAVVVPPRSGDWAVDIRAAMMALVTAMRPHPQIAELVPTQGMRHPTGLAVTEMALETLEDAG